MINLPVLWIHATAWLFLFLILFSLFKFLGALRLWLLSLDD